MAAVPAVAAEPLIKVRRVESDAQFLDLFQVVCDIRITVHFGVADFDVAG